MTRHVFIYPLKYLFKDLTDYFHYNLKKHLNKLMKQNVLENNEKLISKKLMTFS